ncbi:MAG: M16 family metallopeptidase, partial [Candidatus Kapaibacterium sp.]
QGELMTMSMDGLKKHNALMLGILSDVIQNPLFPKEELDKLMPQVIAGIKQEKANPMALAGALSRYALYGKDHPNAQRRTEESVKKISIAEIRSFHEKYVRPNNRACLTVVGDVTMNEILPQLEKAFANWKSSPLTMTQMPAPKPMPRGVYFIQRPGSVQSSIVACALVPGRKDEMYEPFSLATSVLGSGFAGRLFKTLRETYSFTYTPYAAVTQGKYFNRFFAGADVRNAVTDSAILVLKREIAKIANDVVPDDEFNSLRTNELGNYLMTFERSDFVAGLLQNAEYLGMSPEYLKGYAKRLASYSPYDAQRAASKYMRDDQQYLIVVGSPEIAPILAKYGRVFTYDLDLKPVGDNME